MRKVRSLILVLVMMLLLTTSVTGLNVVKADTFQHLSSVSANSQNNSVVHVVVTATFNKTKAKDLFNFVTNLTNDGSWYPGIISTNLVSGNGKSGSHYVQVANLGGGNFTSDIYVLGYNSSKSFTFIGLSSAINYVSYYTFKDNKDGSTQFRTDSILSGQGLTQSALDQYQAASVQTLINFLNKTGTVKIGY